MQVVWHYDKSKGARVTCSVFLLQSRYDDSPCLEIGENRSAIQSRGRHMIDLIAAAPTALTQRPCARAAAYSARMHQM